MAYYQSHAFVCTNLRPDGKRESCAAKGSEALRDHLKSRIKQAKLPSARANTAGCLNRCELGPVLVVYPEGIWYRCENKADIDRIVDEHLIGGRPVESLRLSDADTIDAPGISG